MSIQRILSGIAAAALGAALVTALPGFSPQVEASTTAETTEAAQIEAPLADTCAQQTWPYYDAACLRDRTAGDRAQAAGQRRVVRIVGTERLPR